MTIGICTIMGFVDGTYIIEKEIKMFYVKYFAYIVYILNTYMQNTISIVCIIYSEINFYNKQKWPLNENGKAFL